MNGRWGPAYESLEAGNPDETRRWSIRVYGRGAGQGGKRGKVNQPYGRLLKKEKRMMFGKNSTCASRVGFPVCTRRRRHIRHY